MRIVGFNLTNGTASIELTREELDKLDEIVTVFEYSPGMSEADKDLKFWCLRQNLSLLVALVAKGSVNFEEANEQLRLATEKIKRNGGDDSEDEQGDNNIKDLFKSMTHD